MLIRLKEVIEVVKRIIVVFIFTVCCILIFNTKVQADTITKRLAGNDRYETSIEIASYAWQDESEYAVLATGENYPDALGAAPLAKKYNAPILLTEKDTLNEETAIELIRLKVKKIFIIGGIGAVSEAVEDAVRKMNIETVRIAGNDRYETSVEIAKEVGQCKEVFITVGDDFADALSVASIAASKSIPILLTGSDTIPDCVKLYINSQNIDKIYVVGDSSLISDNAVTGLKNVERITGEDKYTRNISIISRFINEIDLNTVYIATGENYPDALSGTAIACKSFSPIILIDNNPKSKTTDFINTWKDSINSINVLGGEGVITSSVLESFLGKEVKSAINNFGSNNIIQGEWKYYYSFKDKVADGLYRISLDGSNRQKLDIGKVNGFYIDGEWIYYNNDNKFYKIRIDGTDKQKILDECAYDIKIRGQWIYYTDSTGICRVKVDGSQKQVLMDGQIDSMHIVGNWIYYRFAKTGMAYKVDINGNNDQRLSIYPGYVIEVDGNWIYSRDGFSGQLYQVKKDGTGRKLIDDENTKLELENDDSFYITDSFPSDGQSNVYLKFGFLDYIYSKDTISCEDISEFSLVDEEGNQVNIKEGVPGLTLKNNFLLILQEDLKSNTKYNLFVPRGVIQSFDGEFYNRYICVSFKTAK